MTTQNLWTCVSSEVLSAAIDPAGAQLSSLMDRRGNELLWDGDPAVWAARAPLLFPIVGSLSGGAYRVGEHSFRLPRHGFARNSTFAALDATATAATFRLSADEATLTVYPFRFELDVNFAVYGPTLSITTTIRNVGEEDLPASFGYHPGFRWPLPYGRSRQAHFIEFTSDEPAPIKRLNADGLLSPDQHPTPVANRRLMLNDELFTADAMIFDELRSRSVTYGAPDGPRIRVSYPDSQCLGLWSKPGARFICIEPWNGIADPQGFADDLWTKPGIFILAPGAAKVIKMAVTLLGT